ncbi:MAG: Lsr2 family protein [Acidimicrobiales bacterium]
MAQRTEVLLTCDVDLHEGDAEAAGTVSFTVEGQSFEFELCEGHLAQFREEMDIWSSHARPAGRRRTRAKQETARPARAPRAGRAKAQSAGGDTSASDVREWARAQGIEVSSRGRVSAELHAAYTAAH